MVTLAKEGELMQPPFIRNFKKALIEVMEKNNVPGIVGNLLLNKELKHL